MRFVWLIVFLALLVIVPFAIWGGDFERWLSTERIAAMVREWKAWGALGVIGLLIGDLFLPIPSTVVMSASGFVYGAWLGGSLSAAGSFLSGLLAYSLCRSLGHDAALRLVGEDDLAKGDRLFAQSGPWLIALSRALPVLPEITACLAGLTRMPFRLFVTALACGSFPVGFVYAAIGAAGIDRPALALGLSALLPVALWFVARKVVR